VCIDEEVLGVDDGYHAAKRAVVDEDRSEDGALVLIVVAKLTLKD
jgi:hypothetical protein